MISQDEHFEIKRFDDADAFLEELSKWANSSSRWIFRGQRLASWDLRSALERYSSEQDVPVKDAESFFKYEFKRAAHNYLAASQIPTEELEWLALMQHFGAPTRLLDFTHSPWIAAYFALEKATDKLPGAVWAVDMDWCVEKSRKELFDKPRPQDQDVWPKVIRNPETLQKRFKEILEINQPGFVMPVEPYRMNERLIIQQGIFLCAGTVENSFQDNLFSVDPRESRRHVRKIVIEGDKVRDWVLEYLYKMNVNRAALFPGLEGFAQSLEHSYSPMLARLSAERHIKEMAEKSAKATQELRD